MKRELRPAILSVLVLTFLTGVVFPLMLFAIATWVFPHQASGSLVVLRGTVVGSSLIAQEFSGAEWFQPRPSAAGSGYDGTASGATNLAPSNPKLKDGARGFSGIRELAALYRKRNGLPSDASVPIDAVTRSGSGLDPDISPVNALLQVPRVARARGLSEEVLRRLVAAQMVQPQLGFLGEPHVPVLALNLALAQLASARHLGPHAP